MARRHLRAGGRSIAFVGVLTLLAIAPLAGAARDAEADAVVRADPAVPADAIVRADSAVRADADAPAHPADSEAVPDALPAQGERTASLDARFPRHIEPSKPPRPNTLSKRARDAGWILLFDGRRGPTWQTGKAEAFPGRGWSVSPRALSLEAAGPFELRAGGDLFTTDRYGDFVLDFEFALSPGANSGIKYRARRRSRLGFVDGVGCEYQLLDDARHPDAERGRDGNRRLAGLYDLVPADSPWPRRIGDWNHARIHVEDEAVAHYLNGDRVLLVDFGSPEWTDALAASKFAKEPDFCADERGYIVLQDHGDAVRFRNLRIRPLDPPADS